MGNIYSVDAKTLSDWLKNDEVMLVDVREQHEFDKSRIHGAELIPLGLIAKGEFPVPNNKKLVFQCRIGGRSANACQYYISANPDENVWNLEGGIESWVDNELPVISSSKL
jgi:rhodanese-related sulfurtransferase